MNVTLLMTIFVLFFFRMLVLRNLAKTTQPAKPVLQTEITSVCVSKDLLGMIVKTVLIQIYCNELSYST